MFYFDIAYQNVDIDIDIAYQNVDIDIAYQKR